YDPNAISFEESGKDLLLKGFKKEGGLRKFDVKKFNELQSEYYDKSGIMRSVNNYINRNKKDDTPFEEFDYTDIDYNLNDDVIEQTEKIQNNTAEVNKEADNPLVNTSKAITLIPNPKEVEYTLKPEILKQISKNLNPVNFKNVGRDTDKMLNETKLHGDSVLQEQRNDGTLTTVNDNITPINTEIQVNGDKSVNLFKQSKLPIEKLENGDYQITFVNPNKKKELDLIQGTGNDNADGQELVLSNDSNGGDGSQQEGTTVTWQIGPEFLENFKNPNFNNNTFFQKQSNEAWKSGVSKIKVEINPEVFEAFTQMQEITGGDNDKTARFENKKLLEYNVEAEVKVVEKKPVEMLPNNTIVEPIVVKEVLPKTEVELLKNEMPLDPIVDQIVPIKKRNDVFFGPNPLPKTNSEIINPLVPNPKPLVLGREVGWTNEERIEIEKKEIEKIDTLREHSEFIDSIKRVTTNWKSSSQGSWQEFIKNIQTKLDTNALQNDEKVALVKRAREMDDYFSTVKTAPRPKGRDKGEGGHGVMPSFTWGTKSKGEILNNLMTNSAIIAALINGTLTAEDLKRLVDFLFAFFQKQLEIEKKNSDIPATDSLANNVFKSIQQSQDAWNLFRDSSKANKIHENMAAIVLEAPKERDFLKLLANPPALSLWNRVWNRY
ncbi:MAG: hypothetical protein COY94_01305, partial [Verrucomicrobia bacterium CG_4_10_14_0_8_um_filter_43_34]